ncbi:unnamed protein product [Miscanthus lutarioriparius]|uniref:Cyclin-like domain-containing protein n=1 Tax=Miscanthus lutarioriparius TaxID=422564 RepID=A0A811NAI5_9POAL|nr:unnamed protein product [Miscanthus lutarioriparius]
MDRWGTVGARRSAWLGGKRQPTHLCVLTLSARTASTPRGSHCIELHGLDVGTAVASNEEGIGQRQARMVGWRRGEESGVARRTARRCGTDHGGATWLGGQWGGVGGKRSRGAVARRAEWRRIDLGIGIVPTSSLPKVALSVGRDGEARIVVHGAGDILKVFVRIRGGGEEWALEKTVQLSVAMLGLKGHRWISLACERPVVAATDHGAPPGAAGARDHGGVPFGHGHNGGGAPALASGGLREPRIHLVLLLVPNTGTFVLLLVLASGRSALQPKAQKTDASKEGKFTCVYIPHLVEESRCSQVVHYKLELLEETLFLTVNIIDRFLAHETVVQKKLKLVGVTAMLLACKYEEVSVPVVEDLILICDRAYTRAGILEMERRIVNTHNFNMSVPTPYCFMRRFLKAAQSEKKLELLSFFMIELSLVEYEMLQFCPSMLAAAAIYTAQCTMLAWSFCDIDICFVVII